MKQKVFLSYLAFEFCLTFVLKHWFNSISTNKNMTIFIYRHLIPENIVIYDNNYSNLTVFQTFLTKTMIVDEDENLLYYVFREFIVVIIVIIIVHTCLPSVCNITC